MSQKRLRYTLIGEGFAEYEFIPAYMNWVAASYASTMQVSRTNVQIAISKKPSVSKILKEAATLCAQSFADKKDPCDLCIIGVDLDKPDHTDDLTYHAKRLTELKTAMGKVYAAYKDRTLLYVPIQAIDCWINYLQQPVPPNSLESATKKETKKLVYGEHDPDRQKIRTVVIEAVNKADFTKLTKQSRSFNHFHQQVLAFLLRYVTESAQS